MFSAAKTILCHRKLFLTLYLHLQYWKAKAQVTQIDQGHTAGSKGVRPLVKEQSRVEGQVTVE